MTSTPTADLTVWCGLSAWPCSGEGQGELEAPITLRSTPHGKRAVALLPSFVPFSYTPLTFQNWASRSATMQTSVLQSGKLQKSSLLQLVIRKKLLLQQHRYYFMSAFTFCFLFPFSVIYSAGEKHINFLCMLWAFLPSRDQISMQWAGALQNWHRSGKISTAICRKQGSNEIALSCYGCNLGNLSLSHTLENNNHKTHNK